jgi:polar amino acid transport system substrate-binding protein
MPGHEGWWTKGGSGDMMTPWATIFVVLAAGLAHAAAAQPVQLRTAAQLGSAPKFVQQDEAGGRRVTGLCVDINRAIERQDPGLAIGGDQQSLPLTRIEAQLRGGALDIACGLLHTREREAAFLYLDPALFTVTYFLVARAADGIDIAGWDEVRALGEKGKILLIHGQGTIGRLSDLGGLQIDSGASDAKTALHKLLAGRGRFFYHRMPGVVAEIRHAGLESKVRVLPTVMDVQRFHMLAGRHVAPATLERLRRALAQLEASGELKRLFERWYEEAEALDSPAAREGR